MSNTTSFVWLIFPVAIGAVLSVVDRAISGRWLALLSALGSLAFAGYLAVSGHMSGLWAWLLMLGLVVAGYAVVETLIFGRRRAND